MEFDHNLRLHPFYQSLFGNLNDKAKLLVYFVHKRIHHAAKDYYRERQFDFPKHQVLKKDVFLNAYTLYYLLFHHLVVHY